MGQPLRQTGNTAQDTRPATSIRSRSVALVLALATLFLAVSFGREVLAIRQKEETLRVLQAQVADLRAQRDELKKWLDVVQSPEHMRRIGHDQMMMGFPGEERWIPYVPKAATGGTGMSSRRVSPQTRSAGPSSAGGYWTLWREYLFR
ncbi:MAG: hypothetical protein ACP5UM_05670 [Anaerolineae bacterium]